MAGLVSMKIEGGQALEKQLLGMERKVATKVVRAAVRDSAKEVVAATKAAVPNKSSIGGLPDGYIKRSMSVRAGQGKGFAVAGLFFDVSRFPGLVGGYAVQMTSKQAKMTNARPKRAKKEKGVFVPYAVEYGHAAPGQGGSKSKAVPPHPFIRNTFDRMENSQAHKIESAIRRGIDQSL